jgi:hypothetical protein
VAAQGSRIAPYDAAAGDELTAGPEAERSVPEPAVSPSRWVRALSAYERRESSEVDGRRYG